MGADGGSIPSRGDLVKSTKIPSKKILKEGREELFMKCQLSGLPLEEPIMILRKTGRLYNKEAVLLHLLEEKKQKKSEIKTTKSPNTSPKLFRSRKDFTELKLKAGKGCFVCPITGSQMNSLEPFIYFPKCGCVSSLKGLTIITKDTKNEKNKCPLCDMIVNDGSSVNVLKPFKINP